MRASDQPRQCIGIVWSVDLEPMAAGQINLQCDGVCTAIRNSHILLFGYLDRQKTASESGGFASAKRGSFNQLNTWFALTSYRRATCETETPGTRVCAQIIRFSSSPQFRRRRRFATNHSDNVHLLANGH